MVLHNACQMEMGMECHGQGRKKKRKYKENKLNNKPHILTNNTRFADKKKLRVKFAPDVLEIQASC